MLLATRITETYIYKHLLHSQCRFVHKIVGYTTTQNRCVNLKTLLVTGLVRNFAPASLALSASCHVKTVPACNQGNHTVKKDGQKITSVLYLCNGYITQMRCCSMMHLKTTNCLSYTWYVKSSMIRIRRLFQWMHLQERVIECELDITFINTLSVNRNTRQSLLS